MRRPAAKLLLAWLFDLPNLKMPDVKIKPATARSSRWLSLRRKLLT
jgi:hypothetical protein